MSDQTSKLITGNFRATNAWYSYVVIDGNTGLIHGNNGATHPMKISFGNFGDADPEIVKCTGTEVNNIELSFSFGEHVREMPGVVSEDGKRILTKGITGIITLDWMTEEETQALKEDGDPIEAPPGPYKIQPEHLGKLLWITGPPGLGKSTSAQLLARTGGYVYYEADCFSSCKNPYLPLDAADPSLAQVRQKPLRGEGLEKRREVCAKANKMWEQILTGQEIDKELLKLFYEALSEDINKERRRIGGDWVVAAVAMNEEVRNIVRSVLGPDLVFVVLNMAEEDVRERLAVRHKGHAGSVSMLMGMYNMCAAAAESEEEAVNMIITKDMTREDVVTKISDLVN